MSKRYPAGPKARFVVDGGVIRLWIKPDGSVPVVSNGSTPQKAWITLTRDEVLELADAGHSVIRGLRGE